MDLMTVMFSSLGKLSAIQWQILGQFFFEEGEGGKPIVLIRWLNIFPLF